MEMEENPAAKKKREKNEIKIKKTQIKRILIELKSIKELNKQIIVKN